DRVGCSWSRAAQTRAGCHPIGRAADRAAPGRPYTAPVQSNVPANRLAASAYRRSAAESALPQPYGVYTTSIDWTGDGSRWAGERRRVVHGDFCALRVAHGYCQRLPVSPDSGVVAADDDFSENFF